MHVRDLAQYLAELAENNNRAWFVMNKPRYDILRAEFLELTTRLIAGGEYLPPPDRLRQIRRHVIADADGFSTMLKSRKLRAAYGDLQTEGKLTRPPKGFDADTPHAEYIRHKSFIVWNERSVAGMTGNELERVVLENFKDAQALVQWLRKVPTES